MTITDDEDLFRDPKKEKIAARLREMTPEQRQALIQLAVPRVVEPYTRHIPHPAQQVFLSLNQKEAMYGGAAGGGKSDALLMAALQYVDVPGYSALLLRRTWPDLNAPGAILDRARTWLEGTGARQRDGGRIWEFPTGGKPARIQFGYILHDKDTAKFQSAEYQFVGFDELTHFADTQYHYMFSRCRRPSVSCLNCSGALKRYVNRKRGAYWKHTTAIGKKCKESYPDPAVINQYTKSEKDGLTLFDVPLRVRSATNPGGVGHQWVKTYFIDPETRDDKALFVPARLSDNPSLDRTEYIEMLGHLLPVDRERLLNGDWDVDQEGALFQRHWFNVVDEGPAYGERVRRWDMAATEDGGDFTVGTLLNHFEGRWIVEDVVRFQKKPYETEQIVYATAIADGQRVPIRMEQEPGSSGVTTIDHYRRNILSGFDFDGQRSTGDKTQRAYPLASAAQAGNVDIVKAPWNKAWIDEMSLFPDGAHDDQVDSCSGAMYDIKFGPRTRLIA